MARTMKKHSGKHFAAYVRVSTASQANAQTYDGQVEALQKWSKAYGHRLTWFKDLGESGLKSDRPQFTSMLEQLRKNGFDGVVVTKLDRLGRSTVDLLVTIAEFDRLGKSFVSLGDSIDTGSPQGKLTLTILAALAEYERSLIVERLKSGRERAERAGKVCHRPRKHLDMQLAEFYLGKKVGIVKTARILGVAPNTLRARLAESALERS
jgi:DNA invertase Pin-like site-specific DNA recombinase